jgi:hypothetical protein
LVCSAAAFRTLNVLGVNYSWSATPATWDNARAICQSGGTDLASIPSREVSEELHAAVMAVVSGNAYFIGGTDRDSEGSWRWVDGSSWVYTHWTVRPGLLASQSSKCSYD